jgi:hypothetical protein
MAGMSAGRPPAYFSGRYSARSQAAPIAFRLAGHPRGRSAVHDPQDREALVVHQAGDEHAQVRRIGEPPPVRIAVDLLSTAGSCSPMVSTTAQKSSTNGWARASSRVSILPRMGGASESETGASTARAPATRSSQEKVT